MERGEMDLPDMAALQTPLHTVSLHGIPLIFWLSMLGSSGFHLSFNQLPKDVVDCARDIPLWIITPYFSQV